MRRDKMGSRRRESEDGKAEGRGAGGGREEEEGGGDARHAEGTRCDDDHDEPSLPLGPIERAVGEGGQRSDAAGEAVRRGRRRSSRHGVIRACEAHDRHAILHRDAVPVPLWLCCVARPARFRRLISALALGASLLLDIAQCRSRLALVPSSSRVLARLGRVGVDREGAVVGRHLAERRRAAGRRGRRVVEALAQQVVRKCSTRVARWLLCAGGVRGRKPNAECAKADGSVGRGSASARASLPKRQSQPPRVVPRCFESGAG